MRNTIAATLLWISALAMSPWDIAPVDHIAKIEQCRKRVLKLLELEKEQDFRNKTESIKESIDDWIDSKKTRAILIWVSHYKNLTDITASRNDVHWMAALLNETYGIPKDRITIILDRRATKRKILKALAKISAETPDDVKMIVYYSWHWIPLDPRRRPDIHFKRNYLGYLTTYNSNYHYSRRKKSNIYEKDTNISKMELNKAIWERQNTLMIVDACYAWALVKNLKKNEVLVTSSDREKALWYRKSVFSWAVMQIMTSSHSDSLWSALIENPSYIDSETRRLQSLQKPLVATPRYTYNIRENRLSEKKQ